MSNEIQQSSEIDTALENLPADANLPTTHSSSAVPMEASEEASSRTAINIQNLDSWYNNLDFQALHDVCLRFEKNHVSALIGPSGCGKSTLLRWINRDERCCCRRFGSWHSPNGRSRYLAATTDVVDLRRRIGIVFQKPNPFPKSIYDNVAFGPRLHFNIGKEELDELVEWSLKKSALWGEVKDRLKKSALGFERRAAATALYCTCHCSRSRGALDGRAVFSVGSSINCPN